VRWNDPRLGIQWPLEPTVMSARDTAWPDFIP
jgi:dTDP-4-dehydrorhamnose 3,5-epimerase